MDPYTLHRSLLDTTTTTTSSITDTTTAIAYDVHSNTLTSLPPKVQGRSLAHVPDIILRVIVLSVFATVAIWANHEASKGFSFMIVNEAGKYSSPGKRFSIFYESNDKATRIVVNTSSFVEHLLYPNQETKKHINSVTLTLAATNFQDIVSVYSQKPHEYVIKLSPSLMESSTKHDAFVLAVLQGMARVWLWDGKGATPPVLLNGMVEYISTLAGFSDTEVLNHGVSVITLTPPLDKICWKDEDPRKVAGFLRYHDQRQQPDGGGGGGGEVIRRLNKRMIDGWNDRMMDDALGMAGQHACATYNILARHHHPSSST